MGMTKVQFVLTVPAVWSDSAKDATLKAAEKAGMGNRHDLKLISEPEAAAVYTLKAIQPNHLKVGDNFIVCDAGRYLIQSRSGFFISQARTRFLKTFVNEELRFGATAQITLDCLTMQLLPH